MTKKSNIILLTVLVIFIAGFVYVGYRFYKTYNSIQVGKRNYGYKSTCKGLASQIFLRGDWMGLLIDSDINFTDGAHNIVPYDLDNDGKLELIANSYRSDVLILYKYDGDTHSPLNWSKYVIDNSVGEGNPKTPVIKFLSSIVKEKLLGGYTGGAHYTAISDMNGDSRDDLIVAGDLKRYDIVIYETPKDITKVSLWEKHFVYKNDSHRTYHVETGDIDGDGEQDIVFTTKTDNSVGWLKNDRSSSEWYLTWVDNNCIRCFNARVADIDNDGQNDIIASEDNSTNGGKLHFYSYLNNPTLQANWINRVIANFPVGHGVSIFKIIDIDKDGDLDIVTGNHQGEIYILKNPYLNNGDQVWKKYRISNGTINNHSLREIDIGDVDGDGDIDVIAADCKKDMVFWLENGGITFYENWEEHVIDKSNQYLRWCHSVELGDIDGDGDLDVVVAAAASNVFIIYFNNMNTNSINP